MSQSQIIFIHQSLIKKDLSPLNGARWIFFGQDYILHSKWKEKISHFAKEIVISESLDRISNELRRPFMDVMADLGRQYDSVAWWSSRVSERNTLFSPLFLYCCYLQIFDNEIVSLDCPLYVIAEDEALLDALADIADKRDKKIDRVLRKPIFVRKIRSWLMAFIRIAKAFKKIMLSKLAGTDFSLKAGVEGIVLIHTYVDDACYLKDGVFSDRLFPGLYDWLKAKGLEVVVLPVLYNVKRSTKDAWKWFKASKQSFVNRYSYYHLSDYWYALKQSYKQAGMPKGRVTLQGLDISRLVQAERDNCLFGVIDSLLYVRLPLRLIEAGFVLKQVIIPFENMIDEKTFILGLRKHSPKTKIIAFQHSGLLPLLLCQYVTAKESQFVPLPDRIVCNGAFSRNILIREGLPENVVTIGPALRHADTVLEKNIDQEKDIDVLVISPLSESDTVELMTKMVLALSDIKDIKIIIKLHPGMPERKFIEIRHLINIPASFEFSKDDLRGLYKRSKIILSMGSTAILEAFAFGLPVIVVGRAAAINYNAIAFLPNYSRVFFSPDEIRRETLRLILLSKEKKDYFNKGREMASDIFHPVTEEAMEVFLTTEMVIQKQ